MAVQRNGSESFTSVGVRPTYRTANSSTPTLTSGAGVPSAAEPDGSLYLRTDGSTADDSLYQRIGGAWVARDGAP